MFDYRNVLRLLAICFLAILPLAVWWWWGTEGVRLIAASWTADTDSRQIAVMGQAGDLFGGVNALFAAYAFAGVAVAAYFQWRTWQLLARQRQQDSFEPLFFHLLTLNRDLKPSVLRFGPTGPQGTLEQMTDQLQVQLFPLLPQFLGWTRLEKVAAVKRIYLPMYWTNENALGPYLRALFHTFRRIKSSMLSPEQKLAYVSIARATLDKDDLFLLLLNCATELGKDFKPLVEEYGLLKHIPKAAENEPETGEQQLVQHLYEESAALSTKKRIAYWGAHRDQARALGVEIAY